MSTDQNHRTVPPPPEVRSDRAERDVAAGADGPSRRRDHHPLPSRGTGASRSRLPRLQALVPPHLRPRLPPPVPRAPPRPRCWASSAPAIRVRGGSFLVVFMCTAPREAFTCVYSSETSAWSEPTSATLRRAWVRLSPSVLVGNTLYFISVHCRRSKKILEHDMETQETPLIRLPRTSYWRIALVKMVDGRLGFTGVHESKLYLWSREAGSEKYAGWAQSRVIDLETLLRPLGTLMAPFIVKCFVDGVAGIFVGTNGLLFAIDLKSGRITKISERMAIYNIVPYMSFYTPALVAAATGEGPTAGAPSA